MSPSNSARGISAATESMTSRSIPPLRVRMSVISSACSPVSGWEISRSATCTPSLAAYPGSRACSASMKAHNPPRRWASARACSARVVLPDDSGPNTSTIRPRGSPPTPRAMSSRGLPEGITSTAICGRSPSRITAPLPKFFSMVCRAARTSAFRLSVAMVPLPRAAPTPPSRAHPPAWVSSGSGTAPAPRSSSVQSLSRCPSMGWASIRSPMASATSPSSTASRAARSARVRATRSTRS